MSSKAWSEYVDLLCEKSRRERAAIAAAALPITPHVAFAEAPPPSPPKQPTAADVEFERVRAAALVRQEAERQARAEEDAAVAAILGAMNAGEPSGQYSRPAQATADQGDTAANLILSFLPPKEA